MTTGPIIRVLTSPLVKVRQYMLPISGIVMAEGNDDSGYGNVIQIDHGNGYYTVYAHLSKIGVRACQAVSAGQWIGAAGNTGNSRGVHLHFEVIQDGLYVNPWLVLP